MQTISPGQYVADFWQRFDQYVKKPNSNRRAGKLELLAVKRYKKDLKNKKFTFNRAAVDRVILFCYAVVLMHRNKPVRFDPTPWQCFVIANLFGFYIAGTDRRRFRYAYIEIARKNGKTMFSAILALYFLIADGSEVPESLLLATTREQAAIALKYCKTIIDKSPLIAKETDVRQYYIKPRAPEKRHGLLKTLPRTADRLDGYHPLFTLIDEYHAHPDDSIPKVIKSGILGRTNPLVLTITTAGTRLDYPCFEMRTTCVNILNGVVIDDSQFTMIFSMDTGDNIQEPKNWTKPNPNLNVTIPLEDLQIEYEQARIRPSLWSNFLTKNLNKWVSVQTQWIPEKQLQAAAQPFDVARFKNCPVYIGLDLSSTRDLTAAALLFYDDDQDKFYTKVFFFMVNNEINKIRLGGIDLTPWIDAGHIIQCDAETIDYDLIYTYFEQWAADYQIEVIGYDYYNSALIVPRLQRELDLYCNKMPQTPGFFNFPLKYLEKMLFDGKICLSDNPALLWNFRNIVIYKDSYNNIKISKNKSLDSVDGCVALGTAIAQWLALNMDENTISLDQYLTSAKKD